MNLGFVVHDFDPRDGHGRYAIELVTRLAKEHEVTLYAANLAAPVPDGVTAVRIPVTRRPAHVKILRFPRAFARRRRAHDLVHAQGWSAPSAEVITAHIVMAAWRAALGGSGARKGWGERVLGPLVARREEEAFRRAESTLIVPSRRVAADLELHYRRRENVHVIPHAFPAPTEPRSVASVRATLGLPKDRFIALYAGDARKGLDVAIQSAASVPSVTLAVVSRSRRRRYDALARASGLTDRFVWLGGLDDVTPAYVAADVLVHPTIYDAFGLVVAEAMAAGRPAIVSDQAGITDLLRPGKGCAIVPSGDVVAVADALNALSGDRARLELLSEEAREVARSRTWDDVARETMAVYEAVSR